MKQEATVTTHIHKVAHGEALQVDDVLAIEEPLEISLSYHGDEGTVIRTISITMRTPGNDEELAAGFLFTEGIIQSNAQIDKVAHVAFDPNRIQLTLTAGVSPKLHQAERNFYTTSSCGVCGKTSIDAIKTVSAFATAKDQLAIPDKVFYRLPQALRAQQDVFNSTGGLHASALFDPEGNFQLLREDVGRHNALDKLIGAALMNSQLPLTSHILLLSGRASFELIQKAAMAGIKMVVAVGAPSSLAVQLATDCGITLAGFLRDNRFNIYTHPQRIIL